MLKPLIAVAMILTPVPVSAPAASNQLTGRVITDAPIVCLADSTDKLNQIKEGIKEPTSQAIPLYAAEFKLSDDDLMLLRYACSMLERGFVAGFVAASPPKPLI